MQHKSGKATKKVPAKKARTKVVFKFADGSTGEVLLAKANEQLLKQYVRMSDSASPELALAGNLKLGEMAERLKAETMRRIGASKGGKSKDSPKWHADLVKRARAMLIAGTARRDLVGKLSQTFRHDPKTIRDVLKKAGVK